MILSNATTNPILDFIRMYWPPFAAFGILVGMIVGIITIRDRLCRNNSDSINERTEKLKKKKFSIINNLPPTGSIGNLLGDGRKKKLKEVINLMKIHRVVILEDIGGIGKSTLARAIAEFFLHKYKSFNAIIWIQAKTTEVDLEFVLDETARVLDYRFPVDDLELKLSTVLKILQNKKVFFIFDNFETITDDRLNIFIQTIPEKNRILITTRHRNDKITQDQKMVEVGKLSESDGKIIIYNELRIHNLIQQSEKADKIYKLADGLPQAIKWIVGQLQYGQTIEAISETISLGDGEIFESLFAKSWEMLDVAHKEIIRAMLFFVKPVAIKPLFAATNLTKLEFHEALTKLVGLSILDTNQEIEESKKYFSMHSWAQYFSKRKLPYTDEMKLNTALYLGKYYVDFCGDRYGKKRGLKGYNELEYELLNMIKTYQTIDKIDKKEANKHIVDFAKAINVFLWSRGFWSERINICQMALRVAKKLADSSNNDLSKMRYYAEAGRQAYYVGIVFFWQGKYNEAEQKAYESISLMKKTDNELDVVLAERLFALLEMGKGIDSAPESFKKVLKVLEKYTETNPKDVSVFADWIVPGEKGHLVGKVSLLQEIGICYNTQGQFDKAKNSLVASKELAERIQDIEGLSVSLSHLGHSYFGLEKYKEAKSCYLGGLELAQKVQRKSTMARCYEGLAKLYYKKNNKTKLKKYGYTALDLFERLGMNSEYNEVLKILEDKKIIIKETKTMKITKKSHEMLIREDAHGGSGGRKLLLDDNEMKNVQGMTYGFLPAGRKFAWHNHEKMNEVMVVLKGQGTVRDEDGTYPYTEGDVFIYPEGVFHEIENNSDEEHEYIFVRVYE